MLYSVVLATHIFAACVTVVVVGGSLYSIVRRAADFYKPLGLALAAIAFIETVSGGLLTALNPELSVLKVGLHLLAYLGVCLVVEGLLFVRVRSQAWTS